MVQLRNVIVTGAAGGMGSAAVRLLLERGDVNVVGVDLNADGLRAVADAVGAEQRERLHVIQADVSDPEAVKSFVEEGAARWNGLDGIFNIASIAVSETILDGSAESYDRTMNINARSTWLGMKYALPAMLERGGGRIVNVGSHMATRGAPTFSTYAASKHAVVGMTKSIALEYAGQGIVANVVSPGAMDTEMIWETARLMNPENPEQARRDMDGMIPNGRLARPEELAATGIWLLLDSPSHLTGQEITVDGGYQAA